MLEIAPISSRPTSNSFVGCYQMDGHSSLAKTHLRFFRLKATFDRLIGILMLIPALPMMALLIGLIRLSSKGPGVYHQRRVGKDGRVFTMYKLRSMRIDAEARTGPVWAGAGSDPRVTRLGYWLRRLHLDELPQLLNVVRGEMSLVGPRPERPEFVHVLEQQIPGYQQRHRVMCGITGLAQVNLPPDTDLDSVRRKLILDCEYIERASFLLDFRIVACTLLRVIGLRGGRAVSLLGLKYRVELPEATAATLTEHSSPPTATPHAIKGRGHAVSSVVDQSVFEHSSALAGHQ